MRRYRVPLALIVILLGILGALLHPLALALALVPFDTAPLIAFLERIREAIADLLGWGVLALILVMVFYLVAGRRARNEAPLKVARAAIADPKVAVAITAYNDAEATTQAVRDFKTQPGALKVIVVDNNSTDDTQLLARQAGAEVVAEPRQGYGFACIRGLSEAAKVAGADVIVLTEGDGTFFAD